MGYFGTILFQLTYGIVPQFNYVMWYSWTRDEFHKSIILFTSPLLRNGLVKITKLLRSIVLPLLTNQFYKFGTFWQKRLESNNRSKDKQIGMHQAASLIVLFSVWSMNKYPYNHCALAKAAVPYWHEGSKVHQERQSKSHQKLTFDVHALICSTIQFSEFWDCCAEGRRRRGSTGPLPGARATKARLLLLLSDWIDQESHDQPQQPH